MIAPPAQRRVHRVRLTATDEGLVRRGALLLEDALRTMSPPGGERPLFVRTLILQQIDSRQSPAALALQIEARLRQMTRTAVYAISPQASQAAAVFFYDDAEPGEQLALRLVRGQPVDAWFWPLALPGWQPPMRLDRALRHILQHLLQTQAGPAAVTRLVATLHRQASADPLLAALRPADGPALLRAYGWSLPPALPPLPVPAPTLPPDWTAVLRRWLPRWGIADARVYWLAGVALVASHLHQIATPYFPARIQAVVTRLAQELERPLSLIQTQPQQPQAATSAPIIPKTGRTAVGMVKPVGETETAVPTSRSRPFNERQPTQYGGLFFLIPVLARLGMADVLENQPILAEAGLPWHFLQRLCHRLDTPDTDPIWRAIPPLSPLDNPPYTTPVRWHDALWSGEAVVVCRVQEQPGGRLLQDGSGRLPLAYWQGKSPPSVRRFCVDCDILRTSEPVAAERPFVLTAWLTAVRRWCRRVTRRGLRHIVQRPGAIAITPTHLDLFFDHRQADIDIRRAGLDLNPGWVPWLGRVVTFHYLDGNE